MQLLTNVIIKRVNIYIRIWYKNFPEFSQHGGIFQETISQILINKQCPLYKVGTAVLRIFSPINLNRTICRNYNYFNSTDFGLLFCSVG